MSDHFSHIGLPVLGASPELGTSPSPGGPRKLGRLPGLGEQFGASPLIAFEAFEWPCFMFNVPYVMSFLLMCFLLSPNFLLFFLPSLPSGLLPLALIQRLAEGSALADYNKMGTSAWTTLNVNTWL